MAWFSDEIVDAGKLPLMLGFIAFIVTFVVTRAIVRMIRAGKGPFKNNVSEGGMHIHHVVPGVIILIIGGFVAAGSHASEPWASIGGVLVGVGAGLVLDEFALILTLDDVYWAKEGRVSVEMVALAAASLGIFLVFGSPFTPTDTDGVDVGGFILGIALHLLFVYITFRKGKYRTALVGFFLPVISITGAIRLARPASRWAQRFYKPKKLARATVRTAKSDARWAPVANWFGDTVAGSINEPDAAATATAATPTPH